MDNKNVKNVSKSKKSDCNCGAKDCNCTDSSKDCTRTSGKAQGCTSNSKKTK